MASVLKRHQKGVRVVCVEPAESSVLLGGKPGPHNIEGVGIGYTPPLWDPALVDEILAVGTDEAKDMARRLAREESLFAGTSSGANVLAAIRLGSGTQFDPRVVEVALGVSADAWRRLLALPPADEPRVGPRTDVAMSGV